MAGLVPFNRKNNANLARTGTGFEDFYNMLDDFFSDGLLSPGRSLLRDTFKIDVEESEREYLVEAELPGIRKDEIDLSVDDDTLCITVNRAEEAVRNFIHRERRFTSMGRRVRLAGANLNDIRAKLEDGVLAITIPKLEQAESTRRIEIE